MSCYSLLPSIAGASARSPSAALPHQAPKETAFTRKTASRSPNRDQGIEGMSVASPNSTVVSPMLSYTPEAPFCSIAYVTLNNELLENALMLTGYVCDR